MGEVHMDKGRVREDRGSKKMALHYPLQKRSVTTCKNHQEVARSALVKGIELKMAALIWRAAPV
jgi:hypothetical protein